MKDIGLWYWVLWACLTIFNLLVLWRAYRMLQCARDLLREVGL